MEQNDIHKNAVVMRNFWRHLDDHNLYESDLGWDDGAVADAMSDDPERIFRYYIDSMGLNMAFYYLEDGEFYNIFNEVLPIEVRRRPKNRFWDGQFVIESSEDTCNTHSKKGELIYSTMDEKKIWDELRIGGKSIGEVLKRSVILELN